MYFENSVHKGLYRTLLNRKTGGQENERRASLYVLASLPMRFLEKTGYLNDDDMDIHRLIEKASEYRLSTGEKQLLELAFVLYHGDQGKNVLLESYIGPINPLKTIFLQAIELHMIEK